ncbi:MAG: glycosyl transferase [Pseudolabrys sp.]
MTDSGGIWQASGALALAVVAGAALAAAALIYLLYPLLRVYALAPPNARSSHTAPTPQGGGIAVVAATVLACGVAALLTPGFATGTLAVVFAATVVLAVTGATDDIRPLEALPRLAIQSLAVLLVLYALPAQIHLLTALPLWLERALLFVGLLWFVNLVNFMDGIDWMTVAEVVPVAGALALFGLWGALPAETTLAALALCGAMLGFAPFNRPVARLFLGDVGSLPVGLLLGWMLVLLGDEHLAAALLLPLYYVADATITLLRRWRAGEKLMQAHRSHFYQRALVGGMRVPAIVARVFALNLALIALAALTLWLPLLTVHIAALAAGCALVALLLYDFGRR